MRVKEFNNKIAHVVWSPSAIYPSYIATATAAEQVDSSFNTNSTIDLLKLDLSNPNPELEISGSIVTEARFSKLIWTDYASSRSKNVLIGGCENSKINLYDYESILASNQQSALIQTLEKHTGVIHTLDINPFQNNLLASGASASEIFIWDLNNPGVPMTPGAKVQPLDEVNCVSWNNQVQHILASTCSGKCSVWDLRKNESIIKVSDNMSKMKAKLVAWHPDVATQMCLSSDDDQSPFLQLWDLRFATSPVRILEGHQRGILAFNWCSVDSNLLVSSAKDNRIICWNPNNATTNGEILFELPTIGQWCFDLSWCKHNPDLICASSFEGQINVYSLMGGKYNVVHQTSSKIMDSFGVDTQHLPSSPTSIQQTTQVIPQLKIAPKWMKRPCGASFAFGGKLVTFGKMAVDHSAEQLATPAFNNQRVTINQVVTDSDLVEKSRYLENTLQTGNLVEYCNYKIETAANEAQKSIWNFILATFYQNRNEKFLELLGFTSENLQPKIDKLLKSTEEKPKEETHLSNGDNVEDVAKNFSDSVNINGTSNLFDQISLNNNNNTNVTNDDDNFSQIANSHTPVNLAFKNDVENLITELLLLGQYETVVELCIQENRYTDAILIANFFDKDLLAKTQQRYFKNNKSDFSELLEKFLNRDWTRIVSTCNLEHWKEALATIMTYTQDQELSSLCDMLGSRLESDATNNNLINACICYICSANLDNLISCWQKVIGDSETNTSLLLQDLIEKVMVLRYSLRNVHPELIKKIDQNQSYIKFNQKLVQYAKLLADQGCFLNAYSYLNDINDQSILVMKDRLFNVLDQATIQHYQLRRPECPFKSNKQLYSIAKSNVNQTISAASGINTRKNSYQTVSDPSIRTSSVSSYPDRMNTQNNINSPFLPVAPVNHPMSPANIYSAASANNSLSAGSNPFRSNTPVQQPPKPFGQLPNPSLPNYSNPINQTTAPPSNVGLNNNSNSSYPGPPPSGQTYQPNNMFNPANVPTVTQTSQTAPLQSYMHTKPATAWNDPPMVIPKVKPAPQVKEPEITSFFQPSMPTAPPSNQQMFYPQPSNQSVNSQPNPYMGGIPQTSNYSMPPTNLNTFQPQTQPPVETFNPVKPAPVEPVQPPQPPAPVEKGPIPAENQIIQQVFDTLLNKCLSSTTVPTTKRKLEDVSKKLEVLYDKLRDSTLSPGVVQGLHSMIQYTQVGDYQSTLALQGQVVATSNFSEISGFMPGIKVLVQSCQQMNVTL